MLVCFGTGTSKVPTAAPFQSKATLLSRPEFDRHAIDSRSDKYFRFSERLPRALIPKFRDLIYSFSLSEFPLPLTSILSIATTKKITNWALGRRLVLLFSLFSPSKPEVPSFVNIKATAFAGCPLQCLPNVISYSTEARLALLANYSPRHSFHIPRTRHNCRLPSPSCDPFATASPDPILFE